MRKIKCAVIGAGWWACEAHIPALKSHPSADLVAIHSHHAANLDRIAQHFDVPRACQTLNEILEIPRLEAAVVSSTPNVHFEQVRACLESGLHVLVEKPMTTTVEQARLLIDLARDRRRHLLLSCPWNHTHHAQTARSLIQNGKLGRIKMISFLMTNFTMGLYRGQSWDDAFKSRQDIQNAVICAPNRNSYSDPSVAAGGQIYTQVSHVAAYLHLLTGSPLEDIFARFDNGGTAVDVYNVIAGRLKDGTLLSIASTGATMPARRNFEVRVFGTEGMIHQELWNGEMTYFDSDGHTEVFASLTEESIYPKHAPALNLIDLSLGSSENRCPGDVGLYAMDLIERAVLAAF
jgi:predicted dehydrogenase